MKCAIARPFGVIRGIGGSIRVILMIYHSEISNASTIANNGIQNNTVIIMAKLYAEEIFLKALVGIIVLS
jgi:hypothetical protein